MRWNCLHTTCIRTMAVRQPVRRTLSTLIALAGALIVWNFSAPAQATTLDWNFNFTLSNGDTGSGIFVTQDTPLGGPFLITSIQNGELNGSIPITLLAPGPSPSDSFNDNLLFTTSPWVDGNGLGFITPDGVQWAIWDSGWCNNSANGIDHGCVFPPDPAGQVTSFEVAETPLPSTWLMLIGGLVMLHFFAYRGTRSGSAAFAAA